VIICSGSIFTCMSMRSIERVSFSRMPVLEKLEVLFVSVGFVGRNES
jgi:hypothetical protein